MNAVIDEDLHLSLGFTLKSLGFRVFDIRDHLRGASDDKVFQFAQRKEAILFTVDLGFSNIVAFPLGTHYGIVILRFPNEIQTDLINKLVKAYLKRLKKSDFAKNLIVLSPHSIRIRRYKKIS